MLIYDIYIEFLLTKKNKKTKQNKKQQQQQQKKTPKKQAERNLMSTLQFRGVFDGSLFLYLKFDMNKYLKN